MRIVMSSFGLNAVTRSTASFACFRRRYLGYFHTAEKADLILQNMKWTENLANKARSLIFGERKYTEFSPEEQKIVDYYQELKLQEDAVILPNTRAALEHAELEQLLLNRKKKI